MGLCQQEMDAFRNAVESRGREIDDFKVMKKEVSKTAPGVYEIDETVIVTQNVTRVSRRYSAKDAGAWLAEFLADIDAGVFDS
jgi:hypothetical protein